MGYDNYNTIRDRIIESNIFNGNSATGTVMRAGTELTVYTVKSYDTVIYKEINGVPEYFNTNRYSRTTSRLQNIIRDTKPIEKAACSMYPCTLYAEYGNIMCKGCEQVAPR